MNIRGRLARLEQRCPQQGPEHLCSAFVDDQGRILDSPNEAVNRWVGRHRRLLTGVSGEIEQRTTGGSAQPQEG